MKLTYLGTAAAEGVPAIFGFAAACAAVSATFREDTAREKALLENAVTRLSRLEGLVINGAHEAPHILSLSLPGYRSEVLMNFLDSRGICVSRSSACKQGRRSHVLEAMGLPAKVIDGAIRVSFSRFTTEEEVLAFCDALTEAKTSLFPVLG